MTEAIATEQLQAIVERIESAETSKTEITEGIKEIYAEAKGTGFDTKILRKVIRLRKIDRAKRQEEQSITELYLDAVGG